MRMAEHRRQGPRATAGDHQIEPRKLALPSSPFDPPDHKAGIGNRQAANSSLRLSIPVVNSSCNDGVETVVPRRYTWEATAFSSSELSRVGGKLPVTRSQAMSAVLRPGSEEMAMLTETQVRDMTDQELLTIWADQHDYVAEAVALVEAEMTRREIDQCSVHVKSVEELDNASIAGEDWTLVRLVILMQAALAVALAVGAAAMLWTPLRPNTITSGELVFVGLVALFAAVVGTLAIGVWRNKPWAFLWGWVFYVLATIWNGGVLVLAVLRLVGRDPTGWDGQLIMKAAIGTVVSLCFAGCYRTLRKRVALPAPDAPPPDQGTPQGT